MVFDQIKNAKQYYGLGAGIEQVLRYYECFLDDGKDLPEQTELDGEKIFLIGMNYTGGEEDGVEMEAHRNYVDVMYVVEGEEKFYYKPFASAQNILTEYDADDDCVMLGIDRDVASVHFPAGHIAIFFPQDAHLAAQLWGKPAKVRKFIAKVRLDTL